METRQRSTDDEMGEGYFVQETARRIPTTANGARRLAEPEWALGLRHHGKGRDECAEAMGRENSRALSGAVRALRRHERCERKPTPLVFAQVRDSAGLARPTGVAEFW